MADSDYEVSIPEAVTQTIRALGEEARAKLPPNWGVTVFAFHHGEGNEMMYLSTANRNDMLQALIKFVDMQLGIVNAASPLPPRPRLVP